MNGQPWYQGIDLQRRYALDRYIQGLQPNYPASPYASLPPLFPPPPVRSEPIELLQEQIGVISQVQQQNFKKNLDLFLQEEKLTIEELAVKLSISSEIVQEHFEGCSFIESIAQKIAGYFKTKLKSMLEGPKSFFNEQIYQITEEQQENFKANFASLLKHARLKPKDFANAVKIPSEIIEEHLAGFSYVEAVAKKVATHFHVALEKLFEKPPIMQKAREDSFPNTPASPGFFNGVQLLTSLAPHSVTRIENRTTSHATLQLAEDEPMQEDAAGDVSSSAFSGRKSGVKKASSVSDEESEYLPQKRRFTSKKASQKVNPSLKSVKALSREKILTPLVSPELAEAEPMEEGFPDEEPSLSAADSEDSSGQEYQPSIREVSSDNDASVVEEEKTPNPTASKKSPKKNKKIKRLTLSSKEDAELYGQNFRMLRERVYKVGRDTMAKKLACRDTAIIRIEKGEYLKSKLLSAIETVCGMPVEKMLSKTFEKDIKKNPPAQLSFSDDDEEENVVPLSRQSGKPQADVHSQEKRETRVFSKEQAARLSKSFRWLREYHKLDDVTVARQIKCKPSRFQLVEGGGYKESRFYHELETFYKVPFAILLSDTFEDDMKAKAPPPIGPLDPLVEKRQKEDLQKDLLTVIGSNIVQLLKHNEVSQFRFAEVIKTDRTVFRRALKGKYINPVLKEKIAQAFKVSVADLESDKLEEKILKGEVSKIDFSTAYIANRKTYSEAKEYREIAGNNFKALLAKENMGVDELARTLKVPRAVLWALYSGKRCNFEIVDLIAQHFHKTRDEMLNPKTVL